MVYKVLLEGVDIYDVEYDVKLIQPSLQIELNASGSLSFKLPFDHPYYDLPKLLTQTIEVYEGSNLLWFGRPIEIKRGWFNDKEVYAEGALAYFNDSIQRSQKWDSISVRTFFRTLVENHNSQVSANRRFGVGIVDVDDVAVYRKIDYQTTFECMSEYCIGAEGGYLEARRVNGVNYIDWRKGITQVSNQPAQFGLNLLDVTQVLNGRDIATVIIPIGQGGNGEKLTIKYINNGIDYLEASPDVINEYGRITKIVEFDLSQREKLIEAGRKWLTDYQWDLLSITVDIAELSYLDPTFNGFRVGQIVHCTSNPHLIDKNFPILKISMNLDTATKKISIGSTPPKTLTEIYRTKTETRLENVVYD